MKLKINLEFLFGPYAMTMLVGIFRIILKIL